MHAKELHSNTPHNPTSNKSMRGWPNQSLFYRQSIIHHNALLYTMGWIHFNTLRSSLILSDAKRKTFYQFQPFAKRLIQHPLFGLYIPLEFLGKWPHLAYNNRFSHIRPNLYLLGACANFPIISAHHSTAIQLTISTHTRTHIHNFTHPTIEDDAAIKCARQRH